jgi:hypothetical protein
MVAIDVIALVIGVIYGYISPGKEDKMGLLKKGIMYGIIIAVILAVLNLITGGGLLMSGAGAVATVIAVVYLTIFFIIGAFIGDFLESKLKS